MELTLRLSEVPPDLAEYFEQEDGEPLSDVFSIATQPFPAAHFATFPEALVEPCIKAGTSEHGCCPECGAPWERVVEKGGYEADGATWNERKLRGERSGNREVGGTLLGEVPAPHFATAKRTTLGHRPTCTCDAGEPVPCTVLDPFAGSGTVPLVAIKLGRRFVGIDISKEYCDLAARRLERPSQGFCEVPLTPKRQPKGQQVLFAEDGG